MPESEGNQPAEHRHLWFDAQAVRQNFIVMHSNHTLKLTGAGLVLLLCTMGWPDCRTRPNVHSRQRKRQKIITLDSGECMAALHLATCACNLPHCQA